jgi:hypothetical protein
MFDTAEQLRNSPRWWETVLIIWPTSVNDCNRPAVYSKCTYRAGEFKEKEGIDEFYFFSSNT